MTRGASFPNVSIRATLSPRGIIGQAKDGEIGLAQDFALRACVLAAFRVDREELDIAALRKPLANLQAGRPRFAIDEYFRGFRLLRGLSSIAVSSIALVLAGGTRLGSKKKAGRSPPFLLRMADQTGAVSAWRIGSGGGPSRGRISCARRRANRV